MNYNFVLSGGGHTEDLTIGTIFREPWQRPTLGGRVFIKRVEYDVIKTTPTGNPDNVSVTYLVELHNPSAPYRRGTDTRIP